MHLRKQITKENIKKWTKTLLLLLFNPRLLLCLFLGWMITNGWSYILLGLGIFYRITWMQVVAGTYLGLLWIPFTPEKLLTITLAILLLRLLFPKDEQTLGVLKKLLESARKKHRERKKQRSERRLRRSDHKSGEPEQ